MRTQSTKSRTNRSNPVIASAKKAIRGAAKKLANATRPDKKVSTSAKRRKSTSSRRANLH